MKHLNWPNRLTLLRILMIPLVIALLVLEKNIAAGIVFALAAATDFLDGFLARKYHLVTDFGKFLDPVADKLLVLTAMILICSRENTLLPAWGVCVVAARELTIDGLRMVAAEKGIVIAAGIYGKIKTVLQLLCVLCLLFGLPKALCIGLIAAMLIMTVVSGADYLIKGKNVFLPEREKQA